MTPFDDRLPAWGLATAPFAWGGPVASADFKTRPEDFVVEEVLGYEPAGEGEHLYLLLQTRDHNTRYTLQCLARQFGVAMRRVSYSGLKDRQAVTSQWFSVHLPGSTLAPDPAALAQQGIQLQRWSRHPRKLRIGTHQRNRFLIRLRQVSDAAALEQPLQWAASAGVPNYFGPQRFGRQGANIAEAEACLQQGVLPRERVARGRVLSCLRSWWFNGRLGQRLQQGLWPRWQPGDPLMLRGSRSFFTTQEWDTELQQRWERGDIEPAGWLPAADEPNLPPPWQVLLQVANMNPEPRPWRLLPEQFQVQWQEHGQGQDLCLSFQLPKGAFATCVLRELVRLRQPQTAAPPTAAF